VSIELAPGNKHRLSLALPLMAGSGAVGLADAWPPGVSAALFGAIILAPISLSPRRGQAGPRLAELPGGFLLNTGGQNPGYRRAVQEHGRDWQRLGVPLLAALDALDEPHGQSQGDWARLAELWGESGLVAGLELVLPAEVHVKVARDAVNAVRRATTLPVLAKLPVAQAISLAEACLQGGADALVVGVAPRAAYPSVEGPLVEGPAAGPLAFPFALSAVRRVSALRLGAPIIATGGIHTLEQIRLCQESGAAAMQVRSLLWSDPRAAIRLVETLAHRSGDQQ
jgi:dihydroorotate dehydrogenase (NAD+) catalytic subunit